MTTPYGQDPNSYPPAPQPYQPGPGAPGYPQPAGPPQGYGQAYPPAGYPPGYGQQPPGYPGYPPAGFPPGPPARPGMVTAAAVLAFVWGGFAIIASLLLAFVSSVVDNASDFGCNTRFNGELIAGCEEYNRVTGLVKFLAIGMAVIAALLIWGGVVALSGKTSRILVIAAAVYIVLNLVQMFTYEFSGTYLGGLVVPVLIAVFVMNPQSKAWFKAKGGTTF